MASFYGDTSLATKGWEVHHGTEDGMDVGPDRDYVYIAVPEFCPCTRPCCSKPRIGWTVHTSAPKFYIDEFDNDIGEAEAAGYDWIENVQEKLEADADEYYEENRHAIVQMERYEQWRNEY
jgi:hypothetical protein